LKNYYLPAARDFCRARRIKMEKAQVSLFVAQCAVALLLAAIWLALTKALPRLRRRVGFRYSIASALALLTCLVPIEGPNSPRFAAGALVVAILYIQWRRALRRYSMEADTIIRYEHPDLF
jgi:hypothetical protein